MGDQVSDEIVQLAEQAGPCSTTAVSAFGMGVLTHAEDAAADAAATLRQRLVRALKEGAELPGEPAIAAHTTGTAITGNNAKLVP